MRLFYTLEMIAVKPPKRLSLLIFGPVKKRKYDNDSTTWSYVLKLCAYLTKDTTVLKVKLFEKNNKVSERLVGSE